MHINWLFRDPLASITSTQKCETPEKCVTGDGIATLRFLKIFSFLATLLYGVQAPGGPARAEGAVILAYQGVGNGASTSISVALFEAHLKELTSGAYHVAPLGEVVAALRSGKPLPPRTVVITFNEALISVYQKAWPRLKAAGLPFTVFVTAGQISDRQGGYYMNWSQLTALKKAGVTIGNGSDSHAHLLTSTANELTVEMKRSNDRLEEKLGQRPVYFAYPYGEYSAALLAQAKAQGFDAAAAEYSSVADAAAGLYALPRFVMNEKYGEIDRFRLVASALSLPVRDVRPADPLLTASRPPDLGFTLTHELKGIEALTCHSSNSEKPASVRQLGPRRVEIRFDAPFTQKITRVNCTLPGPQNRVYWFGRVFFRK